jgi:hypothetical protein
MNFKRRILNGQRFVVSGMEFVCIETHAYFQTRVDSEESDIDVGSSYYIVRNTSTGKLHRIPFTRIIEKDNAGQIAFKR